ncbi:hypothetical protein [Pontibacillus halophilus]|nr:hypothetical protein [Pontibacillus halophilus]
MNQIEELVKFTKENNVHVTDESNEVVRAQSSYPVISIKQDTDILED